MCRRAWGPKRDGAGVREGMVGTPSHPEIGARAIDRGLKLKFEFNEKPRPRLGADAFSTAAAEAAPADLQC
jgi:hypothetical protein